MRVGGRGAAVDAVGAGAQHGDVLSRDALRRLQPHVSALMNGRSGRYSVARLLEFLNALGRNVEIAVRPKHDSETAARTTVVVHR